MLESIIRYIKGYVRIRISGYSPERFLNACRYRNIYMWGLYPRKGAYEMYMTIQGFKKLKPVIKKTGTKVMITGRFGLPFFFHRYRKRKSFFIGAFGSVCLVYIMSLFIWNIDVQGNISHSDEALLTFLDDNHVSHGMLKNNVNCARIVKDIRKQYNDIIWVSASIRGSRLIIQVKENEDSTAKYESESITADSEEKCIDIIAKEDCIITEIITRKGTPMVKVGEAVKKGDILVSGAVAVLNDNKEIVGYQAQESQADISGQYNFKYEDSYPLTYISKEYQNKTKQEFYVRIGNVRFHLGLKKNPFEESEILLSENQLRIGESFKIPVYFGKKVTKSYISKEIKYSEKEVQEILSINFNKTCENLEKKGVEIIENSVKIYNGLEYAQAKGELTIICDVGEERESKVPEVSVEENINGND